MARCLLAIATLMAALGGCSNEDPKARAVPAPPGAVQPAGDGNRVDEATACDSLIQALTDARTELGCPAVGLTCPAAIRPAGGACQAEYDEGSLTACTALIAEYSRCEDFDRTPCIVTAYLDGAVGCGADGGADDGGVDDGGDAGDPDAASDPDATDDAG